VEPVIERYAPRFVVLSGVSVLMVLMAWLGIALRFVERQQHPNPLSQAAESYLQVCRYQLVPWRPWTSATLEDAKRLNRLVLVEVGTFWSGRCAKLGQALYHDSGVADILKREFVPIKLDADAAPKRARAMRLIAEQLNLPPQEPFVVIFTPEGKPFLAAAPTTRAELMRLLEEVSLTYRNALDELKAQAQRLETEWTRRWVRPATPLPFTARDVQQLNEELLTLLEAQASSDWSQPQPYWLTHTEWLLSLAESGDPRARALLRQRLDALRQSQLWDAQHGGFHTLQEGLNTEGKPLGGKRLIENARLLSLYARASQIDPRFRETANALLDFLRAQLWQARPPGFRASLAPPLPDTTLRPTQPAMSVDPILYADGNALAMMALLDYVEYSASADSDARTRWALQAAQQVMETLRGLRTFRGDLYHSTRRQAADWLPDLALVALAASRLAQQQPSERTLSFAQSLLQLIETRYRDPTGGYYDVAEGKRWAGWTLFPLRLSVDTELPADNALVALAQIELAQTLRRRHDPAWRNWLQRAQQTLQTMLGDRPDTLELFAGFALAANRWQQVSF
jgi:uncharacterized protein YyaL (SSP411 family)